MSTLKAIYVRVSTEEQAKHGYSIKEQIRLCKLKAGTDHVLEYIDEGVTGEVLDRPQLTKLRQDLKQGLIDTVICYDPDRLSRKLMNQLLISEEIEKKALLVFVNGEYAKTPEGMLFYQLRGAVAEFEKAKITERMSHGRRQKARQGKVVRDFQVYGYQYDQEKETFSIHTQEAKIVQLIYNLFTKPNDIAKGINGIANYLTAQNIPTKKNVGVWHRQVVRQILMNEAYTGTFYQNRWNTEGMLANKFREAEDRIQMQERPRSEWIETKIPVIIEQEQWDYAQLLLEESRRRWAGKSKNSYLLSGLLRCSHCGNTMTGRRKKNWGNLVYQYTCEKNTAGAKKKGCGNTLPCAEIDDEIWDAVKKWLQDPQTLLEVEEEPDERPSFEVDEMERIEAELKKLSSGKKRLLQLFSEMEDEEALIVDIKRKLRDITAKEKELTQKKNSLANAVQQQLGRENNNILQEACDFYFTHHEEIDRYPQLKQSLIRMVVREIQVSKEGFHKIFTF